MAVSTKAIDVLGRDFAFPNQIADLPAKLSAFDDLRVEAFKTNDGVTLRYWQAGEGSPLVMDSGWSAHGAMYINLMYLLRKHHKVYVLDQRNHGLSEKVRYGTRISRLAIDVKQLCDHLQLSSALFCGWSMGCSVLWAFIDLFGTARIEKVVFVDEAPSIYNHANWSEEQRANAGAFTISAERASAIFAGEEPPNRGYMNTDVFSYWKPQATPYFENSEAFAGQFVVPEMDFLKLILFDHIKNDWRDVIQNKINVPAAKFSGVHSDWLASQRWIHTAIAGSQLFVYSEAEHGDHFLMLKNPVQFSKDLVRFFEG